MEEGYKRVEAERKAAHAERRANIAIALTALTALSGLIAAIAFPIGTVIVETLEKPADRGRQPMTFSEFWNIAGRAGRAMRDRVGLVVFSGHETANKRQTPERSWRPARPRWPAL